MTFTVPNTLQNSLGPSCSYFQHIKNVYCFYHFAIFLPQLSSLFPMIPTMTNTITTVKSLSVEVKDSETPLICADGWL